MREFAELLLKATEQIAKAVHSLRHLEDLMTYCKEIKRIENLGDDVRRGYKVDVMAALFLQAQHHSGQLLGRDLATEAQVADIVVLTE